MKKAILRISIILSCLFTACFAGFSIAMTTSVTTEQHVNAIAKPLKDASTQENQILQTPTEDDSYYKKLVSDVNQYDGSALQDTLSTTFKHHTITGITTHRDSQNWTNYNPSNVSGGRYEVLWPSGKPMNALQFAFHLQEYFSGTWISIKTGNFTIQDIQDNTWSIPTIQWNLNYNLDPDQVAKNNYQITIEPMCVPVGYDADTQTTRNNFRDGGKVPGGVWVMREGQYNQEYTYADTASGSNIKEWTAINDTDFKNLLNIPSGTSNISSVTLNNLLFHISFDANGDGYWSNSRTFYFNQSYAPTTEANSTIVSNAPFISSGWKVNRIYMTPSDLATNKFAIDDWAKRLVLYDSTGAIVDPAKITISAAQLNASASSLSVLLQIKTNNNDYYDTSYITIPIHVIDLAYMARVANTSDPFWEHLQNGQTRYWNTKPTTRVVINENFVKAIYAATGKQNLISKLDTDSWGFIGNAKNVAIDKINGYALTEENYQNILIAYQNQHDISVLQNLKPNDDVASLINSNNLSNQSLSDYLFVLKNSQIQFGYGISTITQKTSTLANLSTDGVIQVSDAEVQAEDPYKTTWNMQITSMWFKSTNINYISTFQTKIDIDTDASTLKNLYDLDLKYSDSNETTVIHSYLYQTHGIDISHNISFKMEDGSMLDENFIVTKAASGSSLKVGDNGYVAARYWATFNTGVEEYVTLVKSGTDWISPKYSNQNITTLTANFDETKLEYVFSEELQLIINPYQNTLGTPITASTPQSFGIDTVSDTVDGNRKILESWTDGKWSHSSDASGHALFDGVFGADPNGNLDENGRLASGKHQINITLQKLASTNLKSNFTIVIDKEPVKIDVKSSGESINKYSVKDEKGIYKDLYFSHGSIHFTTTDVDLASVQASFLNEKGQWYSLPITIKSIQVNNKWTQVIDSTVDYAGFAKVTITDQADNEKTVYFYLSKENDIQPSFFYDANLLTSNLQDEEFNSKPLDVFTSVPNIIVSSPVGQIMTVTKMEYKDGNWNDASTNEGFSISDHNSAIPSDYSYGKTIASSQSTLPFAGDELKPFLTSPSNLPTWPVMQKQISFDKPGLYRLNISTRLGDNQAIERYVYIKDPSVEPIDKTLITKNGEQTNIEDLPKSDEGAKDGIDKPIDLMTKLNIDFPQFLVKSMSIKYSLLWYTEFIDLDINNLNLSKEGKYLVDIKDIFGNDHSYTLLVVDKSLDMTTRLQNNLTAIYSDRSKPEDTAFWKGQEIWNYYRYEDADHAKWEHDNFIDDAMKNGLTKDQAELLYQHLKQDPNWDGGLNVNGTSDFNFKQGFSDLPKNNNLTFANTNGLSKASIGGIIAGSVIGGIILASGATWLFVIRIRRKAIK